MLSRALTAKPKRSLKYEYGFSKSVSIRDMYEDCIVGFMEDLHLVHCGFGKTSETQQLTLTEVLRASMGVIGESRMGMTEKVVLLDGRVCALKRFRKVVVGRSDFGRRIESLAQICEKCKYLVPTSAYLYSKRVKFFLSEFYPMGSLADLLAGKFETSCNE